MRDFLFTLSSSWNLIYKESTAFGPTLTVSIVVENLQPEATPTLPPSTNEDLLKSIGFLPTEKKETEVPEIIPSYPTDVDMATNSGEPEEISSGTPQEGSTPEDTSDQTPSVTAPFVLVENPCSSVISLSSTDSLHQTAPPAKNEGKLYKKMDHVVVSTCGTYPTIIMLLLPLYRRHGD